MRAAAGYAANAERAVNHQKNLKAAFPVVDFYCVAPVCRFLVPVSIQTTHDLGADAE